MALPFPINANQTDAKSPIDAQLMDALRLNQVYLEGAIGAGGAGGTVFEFKLNGILLRTGVNSNEKLGRRVDGAFVPAAVQLSRARMFVEEGAKVGTLRADVHYNVPLNHGITKIESQYPAQTTSAIARAGSPLITLAVNRSTTAQFTLSIANPKATQNIESIVPVDGKMLITFSGATLLDSDYEIGDYIEIAGATNALNNGKFLIEAVNYDGLPSVLLTNGSGVLQSSPSGTGQLWLFEYTMSATVDPQFVAGETALFSGHTDANNNGNLLIFKTNQGGNNIWVKPTNVNAADQAAPAGQADVNRWEYTYSAAVNTDYVVGEKAEFLTHSSGGNNGKHEILETNNGANNIIIHNEAGVVQAGPAGSANTLRWVYAQPVDPTTQFSLLDKAVLSGHSNANNDGTFVVVELNKDVNNNIVIFNENGVDQPAPAGETRHGNKVITFLQDQAASFTVLDSIVALEGLSNAADENEYQVVEINRGTVLDFNIVIDAPDMTEQFGNAGRVAFEKQSIFTTPLSITFEGDKIRNLEIDNTNVLRAITVPTDSRLTMDLLEVPSSGVAKNLTITVE